MFGYVLVAFAFEALPPFILPSKPLKPSSSPFEAFVLTFEAFEVFVLAFKASSPRSLTILLNTATAKL